MSNDKDQNNLQSPFEQKRKQEARAKDSRYQIWLDIVMDAQM